MTRRRWLAAAITLGALYGCATPPPEVGSGDIGAPAAVDDAPTVADHTPRPGPGEHHHEAPGAGAWDQLPDENLIALGALHHSTTTSTAPPPPPPTTTTVPPPPPPAPPATIPPPADLNTLEQLICSYPWDCATALRVAACESGMNPAAVGAAGERGLFQIHPVHAPALGARWAQMFDPATNIAVAHELYRTQGWRPWSCA